MTGFERPFLHWPIVLGALFGITACDGCGPTPKPAERKPELSATSASSATSPTSPTRPCRRFDGGKIIGTLKAPVVEASGLAASKQNQGVLWAHNDSGHASELYAVRLDGTPVGTFFLSESESIDWEDVAIGPGPIDGQDYLYVADLGANKKPRDIFTVYRVPEPKLDLEAPALARTELEGVSPLHFQYADGESHDAETIMIDPVTGDLILVTKSFTGKSTVFRAHPPDAASTPEVLERLLDLTIVKDERRGSAQVTGGDISRDGSQILIRTYTDIYWWERLDGFSIADALRGPRCTVSILEEPQGEAIGFAPDGRSYFTVSEGEDQPLHQFMTMD